MKKNSLTTAVVAGLAGVAGVAGMADAVNLNADGLGQALIYPYYTTQGGNDTLITVVNTAAVGKAVKVRFLEGRNSREVLDFHLYLSPWDIWSGAIIARGEGAGLVTTDRSCTVPDIARGGLGYDVNNLIEHLGDGVYFVKFVEYAYTGVANDTGPQTLARTKEGYVEVIEMANIDPTSPVHTWSKHAGPSNEPGSCANLNAAWFTGAGQFVANPNFGLLPGDGRGALFGNAMIVNSSRGTIGGYAADAIEGFNYTYLHFEPGDVNPNLANVNNPGDPTAATAHVFDFGVVVDATYDEAVVDGKVDAVSALFTSPRVINEYYLDETDAVTFASEWVITFPTKRHYVDDRPALPAGSPYIPTVRAPFAERFSSTGSCHDVSITVYDREERTVTPTGGGFSPRPPGARPDALCWESQVITFGQGDRFTANEPSDILGSTYYKNVATSYQHGWAAVQFMNNPALRASSEGVVFNGLPVTGFFATNADNSDAGTVLANYSTLFHHRLERSIAGS